MGEANAPRAPIPPAWIFHGLEREYDSNDGYCDADDGYCYVARPSFDYDPNGLECYSRPDRVFLVFTDEKRTIMQAFWDIADPDEVTLPRDYGTRFRKEVGQRAELP